MKYFLYIIVLLSSFAAKAQVSALTALDSMDIWIGDQVNLTLTVSHANDVVINKVDLSGIDKLSEIEMLGERQWDTLATKPETILEKKILLTSFDSGYYKLPPISIYYTQNGQEGIVNADGLGLNVMPVAVDSMGIAPIKDILDEPISIWDWLPYVLGILATMLLGAWLISYLKNRKKEVEVVSPLPVKKEPAHIIANKKLDELKGKQLWQNGQVKAYHSELTYIIREYLENRYNIQALELTTDEIMNSLKSTDIKDIHKEQLREMFQTGDLVKFAKSEPSEETHIKVLGAAEDFVKQTKHIISEQNENDPVS